MPDNPRVLFEIDDAVGVITLNQPDRLNAITAEMAARLLEILTEVRHRDEIRALVLTGAGRAFCAGADLSPNREPRTPSRLERKSPVGVFAAVTRAIVDVDKPVIAALPGVAVGAGLSYALAADRRIGDPNTRMSAIFVKRGLHPDCGLSFFLPRIVGLPAALQMVTTGMMLDATEALAVGLLDELVEEGQALPAALAYAHQLAAGPSVAVDLARRAIHLSLSSSLDQMLYYEGFAAGVANTTSDRREGFAAFMERREPRFKGE
ncbi:MAG: enoyl-CoA hydratase/isomerase family protein [Dehalococcoidia bacterium]